MDVFIASHKDSVAKIVRASNPPDDEIIHVYRGDMEVFKPLPAKKWKETSVSETEKTGPRFIKYQPNPLWTRP